MTQLSESSFNKPLEELSLSSVISMLEKKVIYSKDVAPN